VSEQVTVPWQLRDPAFAERILARAQLKDRNAPAHEWAALNAIPLVARRTFGPESVYAECPRGHEDEHQVAEVNHDGSPAVVRQCRFCGGSWIELLL
jgi:hypothetical protein